VRPVRIEAVQGDITREQVDAIVNAANQSLGGGGGVDGAIHRAAGAAELHDACAALGGCPTGDAKATPGFRLAARWIVHAVGPRYQDGRRGEPDLLASCYRRALDVADEVGARSIAFPAISTGIYGYPPEEAASIAVQTLQSAETRVELVRLVAFDEATLELYRRRLTAAS
jgi:O-acetyl-ADP-ribose deacetylase (regulator of RNase III)